MGNMDLYNVFRKVPVEAKKTIKGGRLNGMTDINPMWRIQEMTNQFGPCGIGWKYEIRNKCLENGANGEIAAFVDIDLFYKVGDVWSDGIPGTGGASFVSKERNGLYTSDECFKMALTDAISVACKALGVGADVYWSAGQTKYGNNEQDGQGSGFKRVDPISPICDRCGNPIFPITKNGEIVKTVDELVAFTKKEHQLSLCYQCMKKVRDGGN